MFSIVAHVFNVCSTSILEYACWWISNDNRITQGTCWRHALRYQKIILWLAAIVWMVPGTALSNYRCFLLYQCHVRVEIALWFHFVVSVNLVNATNSVKHAQTNKHKSKTNLSNISVFAPDFVKRAQITADTSDEGRGPRMMRDLATRRNQTCDLVDLKK